MACCVIGAIIISQLIAVWKARRRIALYAASLFISIGLFAWQIDRHQQHIQQFVWDMQALAHGDDPAVAALTRPEKLCAANPALSAPATPGSAKKM